MDKETKDELKEHIIKVSDRTLQKLTDPKKMEKLRVVRNFCLKDIEQDGALSAKIFSRRKRKGK